LGGCAFFAEGCSAGVAVCDFVFGDLFSAVCAFDHFVFTFHDCFLFCLDYVFFEFAFFRHLVVPTFPAETIVRLIFFLRNLFSADFSSILCFLASRLFLWLCLRTRGPILLRFLLRFVTLCRLPRILLCVSSCASGQKRQ
jgi:hypothetical protein